MRAAQPRRPATVHPGAARCLAPAAYATQRHDNTSLTAQQRRKRQRQLHCCALRDSQRLGGGDATPPSKRMPPDPYAGMSPEQKVASQLNRGHQSNTAVRVPTAATVTKAAAEERNAPGRRLLQIEFKCEPCGARSKRNVNPYALKNGTVVIACDACGRHHLIADNLKQFGMDDIWHLFPKKRDVDINDVRREDHAFTPEELPPEITGEPEEPAARLSEAEAAAAQATADAETADLLRRRAEGRIQRKYDQEMGLPGPEKEF